MSSLLLAKLDQFDEIWAKDIPGWIPNPCTLFQNRIRSVTEAKRELNHLADDDCTAMLAKLQESANLMRNYLRSPFGIHVVRKLLLMMYALVNRCLEVNSTCRDSIKVISQEQRCREIEEFLSGQDVH